MNFDPKSTDLSFEVWQTRLTNRLLELAVVLSFPGILLNITNTPLNMWLPLAIIFCILVAIRLVTNVSIKSKSIFLIATLIATSAFIATNTGFNTGVRLYLIVSIVMAAILLGRKAGLVTFLIGYAINLLLAYHSPTLFFPQEIMQGSAFVWLIWSTADYAICGALTLLLVSYTHDGLKSSFKTSEDKGVDSKIAQTELLANQQRYLLLANNMHDMIWTLDLDLNLTYVSPSVKLLRGYSVDEAMKLGLAGVTPPETLDRWKEMMKVELKNEREGLKRLRARRMEATIQNKDGSFIEIEQVVSFIHDETGNTVGVLGVSRDISPRKKFERAMEAVFLSTQKLLGEQYFHALTKNLQSVAEVEAVVICEYRQTGKATTISLNIDGETRPNSTYSLLTSPCGEIFEGNETRYFDDLAKSNPDSTWLTQYGFSSYMGTPIKNSQGELVGQIAAMSRAPMQDRTATRKLITIFAAHAAGEFNRRHEEGEKEAIRHQLLQAQKIESVGQLAGGIAHDFNNLLVVILGYVDIAADSFQDPKALEDSLLQIRKASERAAELTRQLLSFSRRQLMELKPLDPNALISHLGALLERLLPETISYQFLPGESISNIEGDAGQLEQALVNLAVNSRDAMPEGGTLVITTERFSTTESFTQTYPWITAGNYVLLTVNDTGEGMDASLQDRVFEPFFTTKADGLGTGLGLSVFLGIIKQHQGHVILESELGKGSTFKIYLPCTTDPIGSGKGLQPGTNVEGSETILLVEDEEQVRDLAQRILLRAGYSVILAEDGEEAVQKFKQFAKSIDLVFLDVILPKLSGHQVMTMIKLEQPDMPILLTSGYSAKDVHNNFILEADLELLQKPYSSMQLKTKIREIMSQKILSNKTQTKPL